ncbi:Uma2 family endonuclease [Longimicrobium terrae]|uniref:Uma2 family endonuclease n=1 Tax=Longimicrobium terrae TaxID=1639882 RepID=A0A841GVG4_9BACT|nr:Uma2 family endonuclease [Longimicrobium terrae]MBB4635020.1 Uma2 family endonuclease [Longimicrobium terrae]MBB6069414.1 Uma2 family endonuclease [Longimicrobium terrae]NNC31780.1 hypothetical protein [Longimicrobium terrae]
MDEAPAGVRRWNVDEFNKLAEIGLIPFRGYELLDGVVYAIGGHVRYWSLRDYEQMMNGGLITPAEHAELVEGFLLVRPQTGAVESWIRMRATDFLFRAVDTDRFLPCAASVWIILDDSNVAIPNISILRGRLEDYDRDEWPCGADALVTMEATAPSIPGDLEMHRRQRARFGIPEMWHADGGANTITVYTAPASGDYAEVRSFGLGDSFVSDALSGLVVPVDEILRPSRRRA